MGTGILRLQLALHLVKDRNTRRKELASHYFMEANQHTKDKNPEKAADVHAKSATQFLIAGEPERAAKQNTLAGKNYFAAGKTELALTYYKKAMMQRELIVEDCREENRQKAREQYKEIANLHELSVEAYEQLKQESHVLGEYELAAKSCAKIADHDGAARNYEKVSRIWQQRGKFKEFEKYSRMANHEQELGVREHEEKQEWDKAAEKRLQMGERFSHLGLKSAAVTQYLLAGRDYESGKKIGMAM
ncbi:MAG: hypothetical protein V1492_06450 [Candidatus Micrarchaeota archaeon]